MPTLINIPNKSEFALLLERLLVETNKDLAYCGIGARLTPIAILKRMTQIASRLEHQLFTLYSGGAVGADSAFMAGTQRYKVFLPAAISGVRRANRIDIIDSTTMDNWHEALATVYKYHPNPSALTSSYVRSLMARNSYTILREDLQTPVDFVLCWTPGAAFVGGTSQAMRLAQHYNIPIFNLADPQTLKDVLDVLMLNIF